MTDSPRLDARHGSTQTGMEQKPATDEEVFNWAVSVNGGEGVSRRALGRIDPPLHIFAGYNRLWCTGGRGEPANTMTRRCCRRCLTLAREMLHELWEDS